MPVCDFCNRSVSLETAQNEDWVPDYYRFGEIDTASGGPCCPECFNKYLQVSPVDGEYEQTVRPCSVKDVRRVRLIAKAFRKGLVSAYEAYTVLRECGVTERRALAMLLGSKD